MHDLRSIAGMPLYWSINNVCEMDDTCSTIPYISPSPQSRTLPTFSYIEVQAEHIYLW